MPKEFYPQYERRHHTGSGTQKLYVFPNGYGASVVQFDGSYGYEDGLWELAVVHFKGNTQPGEWPDYKLDYDTPITGDVEGYLSLVEVDKLLEQIEALPPYGSLPAPAERKALPPGREVEAINSLATMLASKKGGE